MRTILMTFTLASLVATAGLAADIKAGQAIYDKSCKSCHGADGTPNAAVAKMKKVEMRDLKSAEVQAMSNDDLKKVITEGMGKMTPAKTITGASLDNLVAYVHSFKK